MKGISLGLALICGTLFAVAIQCAERLTSQEVRHYEIREGVVMDQLTSWSLTANIQVGCSLDNDTDTAARVSRRGRALVGDYTPLQALQQLMKAHGLQYQEVNPYTLYVKASDQQPDPKWLAEDKKAGKAETPKPPVVTLPAALNDSVVVTGSRLDYRRDEVATVANTLIVFDEEKISRLGVSTVGELLKYTPQQPYGPRSAVFTSTGSQFPEMRGLGFDTTLVLINGRRAFLSATTISLNTFDLESIPLPAVERVEVLTDSASAVYGADAVGGVVNIITKRKIDDPILELHAGSARGGSAERRAALSVGFSHGILDGSLNIDLFQRNQLLGRHRDRWNNQDFRRFGGDDFRVAFSNPGNVRSLDVTNLPGLTSRSAAIPFVAQDTELTPTDFASTAGQTNLRSEYRFESAIPAADRRSMSAFVKASLPWSLNAFADFLYLSRQATQESPPVSRTLLVPETNFFNPFDRTVAVDYSFDGVGPVVRSFATDSSRIVLGVNGDIGAWKWETSALNVKDIGSSKTDNLIDNDILSATLSSSDPYHALNVFSAGPGGSKSLLSSLRQSRNFGSYSASGTQVTSLIQGGLLAIPAGMLRSLFGAEAISSEAHLRESQEFRGKRWASAAFAELEIPIVNEGMSLPAIHDLRLHVAARYDSYSDFGDAFNPRVRLTWNPIKALLLHASYGTSFRPPSFLEIGLPVITYHSVPVPDPLRNGEVVPIDVTGGGNPNLAPVTATTFAAGATLNSENLEGFRLGATLWNIQLENKVQVIPYPTLVRYADAFPGRVQRNEPSAQDVAAGLPGTLAAVDIRRVNYGAITTRGIDIFGEYSRESSFGRWAINISATWVGKFTVEDVPGVPPEERVAVANPYGSIARWRAIAALEWSNAQWTLSMTTRYTSSYLDVDPFLIPNGRTLNPTPVIDFQASFDADQLSGSRHWLSGFRIVGGVQDILGTEPPFSEMTGPLGYDHSQGDLRLQFGYLRIFRKF